MITAKELNIMGIPGHKAIMPLAMKTINQALASGLEREEFLNKVAQLVAKPASLFNDEVLGPLAQAMYEYCPEGALYHERSEAAPWGQWGDLNLDHLTIKQMEAACRLPVAVKGALMPDAHAGYGLPIGGVLAAKGAVIPYAVGKDIACRMRLTITDLPVKQLGTRREALIEALEKETAFGMGAGFSTANRRSHKVMDEDWSFSRPTANNHDKAAKQLGSSGSGNHFVEFGELDIPAPMLGLAPGKYLALLSHSGSRGTGESVAEYFSKLAQELNPMLPDDLKKLAWLDLDSEPGQQYWAAMELMGRYAAANHELIHQHVFKAAGAQALAFVENHHNFAWREEHNGEELIVHRKGATPAAKGVMGIVPGSMGTPGFVVEGKGHKPALDSCSHGAGRLMSRTAALKTFNHRQVMDYLKEKGVHLISGGLDEAPMAYKDIHEVMKAQADLVEVKAAFYPRLVKMAPSEGRSRRR